MEIAPFYTTHQGDVKNLRLRILCEYHCNNGWVSQVEEDTKEFLISLIKSEFFTLTEQQQRKLALWLAVASTVWEYTDNPARAIPEADRRFIYENKAPPPHWSMWIGSYKGTKWETRYRHQGAVSFPHDKLSEVDIGRTHTYNSQISTLSIGGLFMHVSSSTEEFMWQFDHSIDLPGMVRLWPIRGPIQWPNLFTLDDVAATAIAERLRNYSLESLKDFKW